MRLIDIQLGFLENSSEQIGSFNSWEEATDSQVALFVRWYRDNLLKESDWTQLLDNNLSAEKRQEWATYRQQLRDIPQAYASSPKLTVFPDKPGN